MMSTQRILSPLFFNGLFLAITSVGSAGLFLTRLPGALWLSVAWTLWVLANYLFLTRVKVCRHCSFYGKSCPMGWGKIVPFLARRGDPARFSRQRWPLFYFLSFALLPQFLMVASLIIDWNPFLACMSALFGLLGLLLYGLARALCCPTCSMKPSCLLSKLSPCRSLPRR